MDLCERGSQGGNRHPWETARVRAIAQLLARRVGNASGRHVLDIGCGDGFLLECLAAQFAFASATGCDIHLSDTDLEQFRAETKAVEYTNSLAQAKHQQFDLILMLDVIEHVEDDTKFLKQIAEECLCSSGKILVTAPAFQVLFNRHDRHLKHFRRYRRTQLHDLVDRAGLRCIESGYLFASLLGPRAISKVFEKIGMTGTGAEGVGQWSQGARVTRIIESALVLDNRICLAAQERGLILPGLSCWMLCEKQAR